jgi:uncharacterized membrane protein YkgB
MGEPIWPVVVLAWIGAGKYVKMESRVLIQHSPFMSWIYDLLRVLIGVALWTLGESLQAARVRHVGDRSA